MRVSDVLIRLQDTTAEIRVRAAMLMVALAVLAEHIGLESILGAFLAGAAVAAIDRDSTTHPHFRTKLDAVGYGFLGAGVLYQQWAAARRLRAGGVAR
jgi:Kef-type K+ transport system membrane component KefB